MKICPYDEFFLLATVYKERERLDLGNSISNMILIFSILGPLLPKKLAEHSMIRNGGENCFILGGYDSFLDDQKTIYKFFCKSGICKCVTMKQEMKAARSGFVAISILDSMVSCQK